MVAGDAKSDLLWVAGVFLLLGLVWLVGGGPARPEATKGPFLEPPSPLGSGEIYGLSDSDRQSNAAHREGQQSAEPPPDPSVSPWRGKVRIDTGNTRYEIQPNQEYITLTVQSANKAPINITGWQLVNNPLRRSRADVVIIPPAAKLFSAAGAQTTLTPVLLEPGQRAIIVTGGPPNTNRWPARVSFRSNICLGYLADELSSFRITPSFYGGCPAPRDESGVDRLDDDCYEFVRRLSSCHTAKFERKSDGFNYVDGRIDKLSTACRAFIQNHFSYDNCLAWHQRDPDFYRDEWRIYLNRSGQLWEDNRETISLFDSGGRLVAEMSY